MRKKLTYQHVSALLLSVFVGSIHSLVAPDTTALLKLEAGEVGLTISGTARSQFLRSDLAGDSARLGQPTSENVAGSGADIDLTARPSTNTRGRLQFRILQDWQKNYTQAPTPLNGRWFDFSGNILQDQVQLSIGDYRAKHTPLTLYAVEPEVLFEPEIFGDRRQRAMEEWSLGDNRLPLQGLSAGYHREWMPGQFDVKAGINAARLRTVFAGPSAWFFWTDEVEKLMGNFFVETRLFNALTVGGEWIRINDDKATSRAKNNTLVLASRTGIFPQPLYQDVSVNSFRTNFDASRWLGEGPFSVGLESEYAMSNYQSSQDIRDSTTSTGIRLLKKDKWDGNAIRVDLHTAYSSSNKWDLSLNLGFLQNDKNFVNDLAQTPTFRGKRILNSLNGIGGYGGGYSSFDALYSYVYSMDPITDLNGSEGWNSDFKYYNGTNNWYRAPFVKSSYSNSVTTLSERNAVSGSGHPDSTKLDPNFQLLFPFGPATPNRVGITSQVAADFMEKKIEVKAVFAKLNEVEGLIIDSAQAPASTYDRLGGGMAADVGRIFNLSNRLTLSGSYVQDSWNRAAYDTGEFIIETMPSVAFKTSLLNAGVYAGVWKQVAVLAGYQQINSNPALRVKGLRQTGKVAQSQWALGLEVKITHAAYVTAEYGKLNFEESLTSTRFSQDLMSLGLQLGF